MNFADKTLSDAIESSFLLNTENAILVWNHINIPLSYKYDISYMMEDLLKLLQCLQERDSGEMVIHWLPDTFRCDWSFVWNQGQLAMQSQWGCTVGHLETLLNSNSDISISVKDFISEWKEILYIVINGLKKCGYNENQIEGMRNLLEQYNRIKESGVLYSCIIYTSPSPRD